MAEPNESNPNPQGSGNPPAGTDGEKQGSQNPPAAPVGSQAPDLQKIIQSETDKIRTEYSKQFKEQQKIIDELRQKTMSESEIRRHKESLLGEREAALQRKELELLAVDAIRENDLPLNLREFIIGKDADETKARAATLKAEFQKALDAAVQDKFKQAGREPGKSDTPPVGAKKNYTLAEVAELNKVVTNPATPQKEREKIQAELLAAMRENRIK